MKRTCSERLVKSITEALLQDRYFLPEVKEKLCAALTPSEIYQAGIIFIVQIDDGRDDPLNLIVEIKGFRREDAKEKKLTMDNYWIAGVNNLQAYGRWAFAEFADVFEMQEDFAKRVEEEFGKLIDNAFKENAP